MLDTILDTVFNGLLMGTSSYSMLMLNPLKYPFAFTASAVGFCHGCAGIYTRFLDSSCGAEGSEGKCMNSIKKITTSCIEIVTLPLINMDLYGSSQQSSALALGHGLFIIPLAFDLSLKFFATDVEDGQSTAVLKDLTILGNIVSLLFFAVNESNCPAGLMAVSAFSANYGSVLMESILSGTGENFCLGGYALLLSLVPSALAANAGVTN